MTANSIGAIPSGAVDIMRQLESGARAAIATGRAAQRCLSALRDIYGAIKEDGDGWRLAYRPQWLRLPPLPLAASVVDETSSTQRLVRRQTPPYALFAEHQTAGLGQRGRGWLGLPGDAIAVSLLLPPPAALAGLPVALGSMLCMALSGAGALRFKWPNDIVNQRREKVAGILTECAHGRLIVGVGVNWRLTDTLRAVVAATGNTPAALSAMPGAAATRQQCAQLVVQTVLDTVAAYREGFAPFRAAAQRVHIAALGEPLRVAGQPAPFRGFADDGALLTGAAGRPIRHISGDIQHVAGG